MTSALVFAVHRKVPGSEGSDQEHKRHVARQNGSRFRLDGERRIGRRASSGRRSRGSGAVVGNQQLDVGERQRVPGQQPCGGRRQQLGQQRRTRGLQRR